MAYTAAWAVNPGDTPSAAKWDQLGANDDWLAAALASGWIDASTHTWTYISATQISVNADISGSVGVGDKISITQTTIKYFYVIGVSVTTGVTTLTVTAGTDFTVANAAITLPLYSHFLNPLGFPTWFNIASAATGFASIATNIERFMLQGRSCTVYLDVSGTSNSTSTTVAFPIAPYASLLLFPFKTTDNGTDQTSPGFATLISTTATLQSTMNGGVWTASGTKTIQGMVTYLF